MSFPKRVYTVKEVDIARNLIRKGYKHNLEVKGNPDFKYKVEEALKLVKIAGYFEFLRTYIRQILQIEGLSQLREAEVAIWANKYAVVKPVEAAGFIIHKAQQMKDFIDGRLYYDKGEISAVDKRKDFLKSLAKNSNDRIIQQKCEEELKKWTELDFP